MILESIMIGKSVKFVWVSLSTYDTTCKQTNSYTTSSPTPTRMHAVDIHAYVQQVCMYLHIQTHTDKYLLFVVPASGSVVSTAAVNTGGAIALTRGTDVSQRDR